MTAVFHSELCEGDYYLCYEVGEGEYDRHIILGVYTNSRGDESEVQMMVYDHSDNPREYPTSSNYWCCYTSCSTMDSNCPQYVFKLTDEEVLHNIISELI